MSNKTLIVGALPSPIGGISTFCERFSWFLLNQGHEVKFIDLYDGKKNSNLLQNISFSYVNVFRNIRVLSYLMLLFQIILHGDRRTYFNFSTAKSVYLLFFLSIIVKLRKGKTFLVLHHGSLNTKSSRFNFVKNFINVFDVVYYISEKQKEFYENVGFKGRLENLDSYYPPVYKTNVTVRSLFPRNILISGSDDEHYNVLNTLNNLITFSEKNKIYLHVSVVIYGRCGNNFKTILDSICQSSFSQKKYALTLHQDLSENDFIFLLSGQDLYIRNNSVDSFGIIVADAVNIGVKVLASDVCERYPGSTLFRYIDENSFLETLMSFYDLETTRNNGYKTF